MSSNLRIVKICQLHMAFQGAFGWENSHLFQFCERDLGDPVGYGIPDDFDSDTKVLDAKKTKMSKVFKRPGQQYHYIYDFGDYWKHQIKLENIEEEEIGRPYCLGGEGACPPEDIGGIHGYQEMLEAFERSDTKEKNELRQWLGLVKGEKWDASFCSVREVNKRLCLLG